MTPRVDLSGVRAACQRRGCSSGSDRLHRHHTGCEHMFVRHFAARAGTPRYDAFRRRYESFKRGDTIILCDECHFELHVLYGPTIRKHQAALRKPMSQWTWTQARRLMDELRALCASWVQRPGDFTVKTAFAARTISTFNLPQVRDKNATIRRLSGQGE